MAAILGLQEYGSDTNSSDGESKMDLEDFNMHLKPVNDKEKSYMAVCPNAAPAVAPKVINVASHGNQTRISFLTYQLF